MLIHMLSFQLNQYHRQKIKGRLEELVLQLQSRIRQSKLRDIWRANFKFSSEIHEIAYSSYMTLDFEFCIESFCGIEAAKVSYGVLPASMHDQKIDQVYR
jgi:hypothetical protein